jgi:hypothetical protein
MKIRYLLSLVACVIMLYFALPRLPLYESGLPGYFSIAWLAFLLLAISGNLAALLYMPDSKEARPRAFQQKRKVRSYQ